MFIEPQGPDLTAEQVRELNQDFFTAQPFEFFASRIASLITSSNADTAAPAATGLGSDISAVLGIADPAEIMRAGKPVRDIQLAVDALAIRHHVAEALVRLYHALTINPQKNGDPQTPPSVWTAIADGPRQTADLVRETRNHLFSDTGTAAFPGLVLPSGEEVDNPVSTEPIIRVQLMAEWLLHSMRLLDRDDIDINTAHNKLKHGLAVRSRNDLRVTLVTRPLNPDGTVPLSALTSPDAVDLIDSVSLDLVSRPRPVNGRKQGLEVTTLRLNTATVLAEAWMIALTYGAMFHVAAATHFGDTGALFAPYPAIPAGPRPDQLLKDSIVGFRGPLTTPPDGGPVDRGSGIAFHEGFMPMNIDHAGQRSSVVADN